MGNFAFPLGSTYLGLLDESLEEGIPLGLILHCYPGAIQPRSLEQCLIKGS